MKCPECGHKLSTKHYDAAYEWFECPGCEGCFTYDEILEGVMADESDESEEAKGKGNRSRKQGKKAAGGRGKKRKDSGRKNGKVPQGTRIVAKGKKRRTEIEEDEKRAEDHVEEIVKHKVKAEQNVRHRDEVDSLAVVNIWGDEIQDVYEELGFHIDEANAQNSALILWREIHYNQGVNARAQEVPHAVCKEHT